MRLEPIPQRTPGDRVHQEHNWQISDDSGDDVYRDRSFHDRKSTLVFNAGYWLWKERLMLNANYATDYGLRLRFDNTT